MKRLSLLAILSLVALVGCSHEEDSYQESPKPDTQSVPFDGKNDPAFVGKWDSVDGRSTMTLSPDGTSRIKSMVMTPGGSQSGDNAGKWKSADGNLLIQSGKGNTVLFYATFKGKDMLELRRVKTSKIKTVYKRKTA